MGSCQWNLLIRFWMFQWNVKWCNIACLNWVKLFYLFPFQNLRMVNKSHIERPIFNFEIFSRDLIEILCGQLSGYTRHMTVSPVESAVTVRGNSSEVNHNLESDRFNSSSVYLSDISTNFNGSWTISNYCALWYSCEFSVFGWNLKFCDPKKHFLTQKWTWGKGGYTMKLGSSWQISSERTGKCPWNVR